MVYFWTIFFIAIGIGILFLIFGSRLFFESDGIFATGIVVLFICFIVSVISSDIEVRHREIMYKPVKVFRTGNKIIVTEEHNVHFSENIMLYKLPDSLVCILRKEDYNPYNSKCDEEFSIKKCQQKKF